MDSSWYNRDMSEKSVQFERGGLVITDMMGRIVYGSESMVARTGFRHPETIGAKPGSLWGGHGSKGEPHGQREKLANFQSRRITLAHADLSGFSLFEEAQYRGVLAAERIMRARGVRFKSSI